MLGALDAGGTAAGVLADGLLRAATLKKFRMGLMAKNLALVSPFNPEAGFDVGNAMRRNKYVYCLSSAAIVVSSSRERGGTWNGAIENLRAAWVPLWVKPNVDSIGNKGLVEKGGRWLPETGSDLTTLVGLENSTTLSRLPFPEFPRLARQNGQARDRDVQLPATSPTVTQAAAQEDAVETFSESTSFYRLFLRLLQAITEQTPITIKDLLNRLDVEKNNFRNG